MQKLLIKGKKDLSGSISISGSKNATLPILEASILAKKVKLTNVPLVKDNLTMIELLKLILTYEGFIARHFLVLVLPLLSFFHIEIY